MSYNITSIATTLNFTFDISIFTRPLSEEYLTTLLPVLATVVTRHGMG